MRCHFIGGKIKDDLYSHLYLLVNDVESEDAQGIMSLECARRPVVVECAFGKSGENLQQETTIQKALVLQKVTLP
jgi:hypothetical protein